MKMRKIVATLVMFAGMTGNSLAFDARLGEKTPALTTPVSCDVAKLYTDKQAACAAACEDQYIRDKQKLELDAARAVSDKKACDAKCGCEQNSK
jgi:hypothetical protein